METRKAIAWIKSAALAAAGGGVAGAFTAAMDPARYNFPHDLGSGRLWKYFAMGAALTFGGMLLHSPLGQSAMQAYKDAQQQMTEDKAALEKAKADLKAPPQEKREPGK